MLGVGGYYRKKTAECEQHTLIIPGFVVYGPFALLVLTSPSASFAVPGGSYLHFLNCKRG